MAGDYEQRLGARQAGGEVVDKSVDEILLLGITCPCRKLHPNWREGLDQVG
jgi:hypothetical protein